MEEGTNRAAEELFVAVASKLAGEGAGFVPKCQESRLNVVVLEGFQTERPVIPGSAID
jgi:hypothetical protein